MTPMEQADAWVRTRDHMRNVLHAFGSRVQYDDDASSSQGSATVTQAPTMQQPTAMPPPQYCTGPSTTVLLSSFPSNV